MGVTAHELKRLINRYANEKLIPFGFSKRPYDWVKVEGDLVFMILFIVDEHVEGKILNYSYFLHNVRFQIVSEYLFYSLCNNTSDFKFDLYSNYQAVYSSRVLYFDNIIPEEGYVVNSLDEAEEALQMAYEGFNNIFIPFADRCKDIRVLERELNEGLAWKWWNSRPGPVSPGSFAWGLIYAKMVSETRYMHIKDKFAAMMKAQESVLLDKDKEYWNLNLHYWYKALAYLDSTSTEALNKLTDELLVKYNAPAKPTKKRKSPSEKNKAKRKEKVMEEDNIITGFDCDGEPDLRMDEDGSLRLVFNFMPPLNGQEEPYDHPIFERFDEVLSRALGVEVLWEDREVFLITNPTDDTVQKAKAFLESFWEQLPKLEQDAGAAPPAPPPPPVTDPEPPQYKKRKWWPF
jgi:hypothetical protein